MKRAVPFIFLVFVAALFFYQAVFFGRIPFPGDMLIAQYVPWKYETILGFNPGSYPNKAQYFDVLQQLFPWKQLVIDQIQSGKMPLWNPYNFSGAPLLANIQSSVFNPINLIFLFIPVAYAWTISVFLQCLLASIFTYLFARKISLPVLPSILSSVGYSYSLFMTVFLEYNTIGYVVALLPATLYCFERYREKRLFARTILFTLSVTLLFLVGHLQLAVAAFIFLLFYILFSFRFGKSERGTMHYCLGLMVLSVVIASIQLLPSVELILLSARVPQDYSFLVEKLLIQPWQFIMIFIPDIFGNPTTRNFISGETYPTKALGITTLGLLFSVFGMWQLKHEKRVGFFLGALGVVLLLVTRNPLSMLLYSLKIPLLSTSSPSNMIFLSSFCLSLLAGFGMKAWGVVKVPRQSLLVFCGGGLFFFFLSYSHRDYFQEKNILFSLGFLLVGIVVFLLGTYRHSWVKALGGLCLFLVIAESFFFFQKFNPFVPKELLYPETKIAQQLRSMTLKGDRIWSFGNATIEPNIQTELRLFSPEGYDPLYPADYGELLYATKEGKFPESFDSATRSNAVIAPQSDGTTALLSNGARMKVLNLLSVRFILDRAENASSEKTFPDDAFERVYYEDGWSIYENKNALPRAWISSSAVIKSSPGEFSSAFFSPSFKEDKTIILSEDVGRLTMKQGSVTEFLSQGDRMLYKTRTDGTGVLVLAQIFYPGWKVFIDGNEQKILRVNHALSGVVVPEGEHDVAYYYWPESFVFGIYLSIIGIVLLLSYAWIIKKRFLPK